MAKRKSFMAAVGNEICKRDGMTCAYCGKVCVKGDTRTMPNPKDAATIDHIVPQSELKRQYQDEYQLKKALYDTSRLILTCMGCNSTRHDYSIAEFCNRKGYSYTVVAQRIYNRTGIKI